MQMQIEILAVTSVVKPTAKGSYTQLDVAYKRDGKTEGKKIMSFGAGQPAFNVLKNATSGQVYTVTSVKNEQTGYWDWTNAEAGAAGSAPTGKAPALSAPKNTYETAEERAAKQVYIVRQSSLSNAIALLKNDKKATDVKEVIATAKQLEAYVFDTEEINIADMDDDVPL